jgi:membrane-bound acyltransferase YfiQ involved in biofilm formation
VVEAGQLLHRSPLAIFPFLALGALISSARTKQRLLITLATVALHFGLTWMLYVDHREVWWIVVIVACVFVPNLTLPLVLARAAVIISAYSLMIYLVHPLAFLVFYKYFGADGIVGVVGVVFQIVAGIGVGIVMRRVLEVLGVNRLAGLKVTFFPSRRTDSSLREGSTD